VDYFGVFAEMIEFVIRGGLESFSVSRDAKRSVFVWFLADEVSRDRI
jgi:hypothetical protein